MEEILERIKVFFFLHIFYTVRKVWRGESVFWLFLLPIVFQIGLTTNSPYQSYFRSNGGTTLYPEFVGGFWLHAAQIFSGRYKMASVIVVIQELF